MLFLRFIFCFSFPHTATSSLRHLKRPDNMGFRTEDLFAGEDWARQKREWRGKVNRLLDAIIDNARVAEVSTTALLEWKRELVYAIIDENDNWENLKIKKVSQRIEVLLSRPLNEVRLLHQSCSKSRSSLRCGSHRSSSRTQANCSLTTRLKAS